MVVARTLGWICVGWALVGCAIDSRGSSPQTRVEPSSPDPGSTNGGGTDIPPAVAYPAFKPDLPQLVTAGGPVLKSPVIVTVTWNSDPNAATFEAFGDAIGQSDYWSAMVSEYGVGAATSGASNHVRVDEALGATIDSKALETWIATKIRESATSHWPAPTDQSLYVVYMPPGPSLTQDGVVACEAFGGYHGSVKVDGKNVAFAVVVNCPGIAIQERTITASHEIGEASTDPYPDDNPSYQRLADEHLAWELMYMGAIESGDMCDPFDDSYVQSPTASFPYVVERQWSNKAAAAGREPCVPAAPLPYFNVVGLDQDALSVALNWYGGPQTVDTRGYRVAVGDTRVIRVGLYSEAPTEAWQISAMEIDLESQDAMPLTPAAKPKLTLSLDKSSGVNGDVANLSVKVGASSSLGAHLVVIRSQLGDRVRYQPLLVGG